MCPKPKHISSQATLDLFFVIPVIAVKRGDWLANISSNYNPQTKIWPLPPVFTTSTYKRPPILVSEQFQPPTPVPVFHPFLSNSSNRARVVKPVAPLPQIPPHDQSCEFLSPSAIQLPTCLPLLVLNIALPESNFVPSGPKVLTVYLI